MKTHRVVSQLRRAFPGVDHTTLEDAASEAELEFHRTFGRWPTDDHQAWVTQRARHRILDGRRRPTRTEVSSWIIHQGGRSRVARSSRNSGSLSHDVARAFRNLNRVQRTVLILALVEDLPMKAVAARIGKTETNTRTIKSRALNQLRAFLRARVRS